MKNSKKIPKYFILDVDGVITNGQMIYDKVGKKFKTFGPDDTDALKVLQQFIKIHFVSGDKKGFSISKKRVTDMGFKISFVPSYEQSSTIMISFFKSFRFSIFLIILRIVFFSLNTGIIILNIRFY